MELSHSATKLGNSYSSLFLLKRNSEVAEKALKEN